MIIINHAAEETSSSTAQTVAVANDRTPRYSLVAGFVNCVLNCGDLV